MPLADFTDVGSVKTYAAIASATDDALITSMITAYSQWIRSNLNRDINSASYDIRVSGRGTYELFLPQYPVTAVALLEINGLAIPVSSGFGVHGYAFDSDRVGLTGHCFTRSFLNVHIQFTAGYSPIPADIAQATVELVALRYKLRDKLEWSSKSLAGESVTLITRDMPASVKTVLDSYRNVAPI